MVFGDDEVLLSGVGRRRVVRVGEQVRMIPMPARRTSHLLRHLQRTGFDGAPRWLGRTDDGHDLLTYVEGSVPDGPPYNFDDEQLVAAGDLVRRLMMPSPGRRCAASWKLSATAT